MIKIVLIALALTLFSGCAYSPARLALAASANTRQCIHTHNHTYTQRQQTPAPTPAPSDTQPEDIMDEINATRKKYGLPVLTYNTELERGAFIRAKEASADFCHYRPDGSPCTTVSEIADGEVLSRGPWWVTSGHVIEGWLDSPLHRDAILRNDEMEMGAGYYLDESTGTVAWCVMFHLIYRGGEYMSVTTLNGRLVRPGFGAFAYEDDDTKERDVDFYIFRPVTKAELRARYVYCPSPEDTTFTFSLEPELADYFMGWCGEMEVTPERFVHALIRAVKKYDDYPWEEEE